MRRLIPIAAAAAAALVAVGIGVTAAEASTTAGIDVSHHNGAINWTSVHNAGIQFAYIKDTEGTSYKDPTFNTNYTAAYHAGVIRGAYHFALPNVSSGASQADFFVNSGGAWSADNHTLPGALDMEYNPYGSTCYGLSQSAMRSWVASFLSRYKYRTGRYAVIYTSYSWWSTCTGNYGGFVANYPLWVPRYANSPGTLPGGWPVWTFWQYTSSGTVSGVSGSVDRDYFNGTRDRLLALANNTP
jgi:GH25 family lysozyme M1 (1,4-beta-N-acetylmuramidase)